MSDFSGSEIDGKTHVQWLEQLRDLLIEGRRNAVCEFLWTRQRNEEAKQHVDFVSGNGGIAHQIVQYQQSIEAVKDAIDHEKELAGLA